MTSNYLGKSGLNLFCIYCDFSLPPPHSREDLDIAFPQYHCATFLPADWAFLGTLGSSAALLKVSSAEHNTELIGNT